ncbi:MAG TPA: hypothetical protein VL728_04540 [Cyclobacteriaceae bacterium]|jgi:hypothetical protein|nr:hypothetical protein [Cyclobacteriaceae bacterium]
MDPLLLFSYISILTIVFPIAMGLVQLKQLQSTLKLILLVSVISLLSDAVSFILIRYHLKTWLVLNIFYVIQVAIFFVALGHKRSIPRLRLFFYAWLAFAIINFFLIETSAGFNTNTGYAGGILMIASALNFLYQLINEVPKEKLQTLPSFWLSFAILVYYGGTLFLFLFNNYLLTHLSNESHQTIWVVLHVTLNITKNAFLFTSLWVNYRSKTSPL